MSCSVLAFVSLTRKNALRTEDTVIYWTEREHQKHSLITHPVLGLTNSVPSNQCFGFDKSHCVHAPISEKGESKARKNNVRKAKAYIHAEDELVFVPNWVDELLHFDSLAQFGKYSNSSPVGKGLNTKKIKPSSQTGICELWGKKFFNFTSPVQLLIFFFRHFHWKRWACHSKKIMSFRKFSFARKM